MMLDTTFCMKNLACLLEVDGRVHYMRRDQCLDWHTPCADHVSVHGAVSLAGLHVSLYLAAKWECRGAAHTMQHQPQ